MLEIVREHGVRVVILKHVERSYVDGVAFWTDEGEPAIGLSLRYDRIDAFWFTFMHEIAHLLERSRPAHLDVDGDEELEVNARAQEWLRPAERYQRFVAARRFTETAVRAFAAEVARHPGIVAGRLHHDGLVPCSRLRMFLAKVSPHIDMSF